MSLYRHPILSSCTRCSYRNHSIPYKLVQNKNLTKVLVFKSHLSCPEEKSHFEPLVFKYDDDKLFMMPGVITTHNVDSIIRQHLKTRSVLHKQIPSSLQCGKIFDYKTITSRTIIFKKCEEHDYRSCVDCKRIRENRVFVFDGTMQIIKDSYGIIEDICSSLDTSVSDKEEKNECIICLENIAVGERKKNCHICNKVYHLLCIQKWITNRNCCPHCRTSIDENLCFYFLKSRSVYTFSKTPSYDNISNYEYNDDLFSNIPSEDDIENVYNHLFDSVLSSNHEGESSSDYEGFTDDSESDFNMSRDSLNIDMLYDT